MESLKGSFLIASPDLADPNFRRAVVFMVEHNDDGAFGLVLSRPTTLTLADLCEQIFEDGHDLPSSEVLVSYAVFAGGPVQHSAVFFLHTLTEVGGECVEPGICLGNQSIELLQVLQQVKSDDPPRMRVFCGYSGWAAGQLEKEIKAGGWLVRKATIEQIFDPSADRLWNQLISTFGGDLGILGMMPGNPEMN